GISELSAFEDLGLLPKSNNIDNEIEVLKSRSLMTLVAKELRLNIRYFVDNVPIRTEHFSDSPVYIRFINGDSTIYNTGGEFVLHIKSARTFELEDDEGEKLGTFEFGQQFDTPL